jgi:type I restriction enzyme M protein
VARPTRQSKKIRRKPPEKATEQATAEQLTLAVRAAVDTEVEAYVFIREQLGALKWRLKDPSRSPDGEVWTQNQCLSHQHMKAAFGKKRPENVVKLSENLLWVIEAKAHRRQLDLAVEEATEYYAKRVNETPGRVKAVVATGVAGNENAGYLMRTVVLINGRWKPVTINGQEATGLLSRDDVRRLLETGGADIQEFAPPQWLFIRAAEHINAILHGGGINKNDRAKTMAALLLSVIGPPPNLDTDLPVLIDEINARSAAELRKNNKPDFAPFVRILQPTNISNHVKFRAALVRTILELLSLNIRSAMNSSTDVLGQFYEVFLKYGNGAKEIGIVLTPRHITRFAVQAVGVGCTDVVLDPACGTGGFLVAAFDHVRRTCSAGQLEKFRLHNLWGVEQESYVAVLAIVNMIFRGDGKNNITEGNCFSTYLTAHAIKGHPTALYCKTPPEAGEQPVTRVLMNPPFALPGTTDREYRFVTQALSIMADGGLLFSLLPLDQLFGARDERVWRRDELLRHHTLLSVISLPDELFYPAALKQVVGVIIRKGVPHPPAQSVFWGRVVNDGHIKIKSKRIPGSELDPPRNVPNDIPSLLPMIQSFIANPVATKVNEPLLCKTAPIDFGDPLLELLPEAYIDTRPPTQDEIVRSVDDLARETAAFLIRFRKESGSEALDASD